MVSIFLTDNRRYILSRLREFDIGVLVNTNEIERYLGVEDRWRCLVIIYFRVEVS